MNTFVHTRSFLVTTKIKYIRRLIKKNILKLE